MYLSDMCLLYLCEIYLTGTAHGLHGIRIRVENINRVINALSFFIHISPLAYDGKIES
ncbi:hypothetical protein SRABI106_01227 [Rahnella aquatilis]|nr:hypothetical protein SRABI106_01227 [Rahnella aquatilis]